MGCVAAGTQKGAIFGGEGGPGEQVGAVAKGLFEGSLASPAADGDMVTLLEDVGDGEAAKVGGAGVVWVVEQAAGAVGAGRNVARDPG